MISMRSSLRWWRENPWTEESALRAQGNSWWYLKGSRVRLTSGLLAPRHLDLMNAADQKECNPSRLHFHRSWRSERFMTANLNSPGPPINRSVKDQVDRFRGLSEAALQVSMLPVLELMLRAMPIVACPTAQLWIDRGGYIKFSKPAQASRRVMNARRRCYSSRKLAPRARPAEGDHPEINFS